MVTDQLAQIYLLIKPNYYTEKLTQKYKVGNRSYFLFPIMGHNFFKFHRHRHPRPRPRHFRSFRPD
jgi:hypothetical protein